MIFSWPKGQNDLDARLVEQSVQRKAINVAACNRGEYQSRRSFLFWFPAQLGKAIAVVVEP
jgi:hypothetical protein